jgi:hypothetical protein
MTNRIANAMDAKKAPLKMLFKKKDRASVSDALHAPYPTAIATVKRKNITAIPIITYFLYL